MKNIIALLLILTASQLAGYTASAQQYPNYEWTYLQDPGKAGWDEQKLQQLKKYLIDSTYITGYMIISKGRVAFSYGDLVETSYIASCRKGILSMLYGKYVRSGQIKLNQTLEELGIDDIGGLSASEKKATIKDLISARSGVYHPASLPGDHLECAPKRGSVQPGSYWLYSNWDFNLAGYVFEKLSGQNLYDEVDRRLARPLHMQDWERADQHKNGDLSKSKYPAYPMTFSTRDMARIGQLMVNKGKWGEKQLVEEYWINEMLKARTDYTEVNRNIPDYRNTPYQMGYGYMWWLWQHTTDPRFKGSYSALGNMGQSISVFPAANLVIVYKTKSTYERENTLERRLRVLSLGVEAYSAQKAGE